MAALRPHTFEPDERSTYCCQCQLPFTNQIHTVRNIRTRVVLSIDHPIELTPEDVIARLLDLFTSEPMLMLVDVKQIQ